MSDWSALALEFDQNVTVLQTYARVFHDLVSRALHDASIRAYTIQHRVKTKASVLSKAERRRENVASIFDFSDLIGIRVILLYELDVEAVNTVLADLFEISLVVGPAAPQGIGGGNWARHLDVVLPPASRLSTSHPKLRAEVQIWTRAQQLFAALDHDSAYKRTDVFAQERGTVLSRLKYLLDDVDHSANELRKLEASPLDKFTREVDADVNERGLAEATVPIELNEEDFRRESYALDVHVLKRFIELAFPERPVLNSRYHEELGAALGHFAITDTQSLRSLLHKHHKAILKKDDIRGRSGRPRMSSIGLVRDALELEFPHRYAAWKNARYKVKKPDFFDLESEL